MVQRRLLWILACQHLCRSLSSLVQWLPDKLAGETPSNPFPDIAILSMPVLGSP